MNKQQAYEEFWSSFGVLAFEENAVPDDDVIQGLIQSGVAPAKFPYIAYQVITDDLGNAVYPSATIWDNSSSWERSDTLANAISNRIQNMGTVKLDNGRMFITKASPFSNHLGDSENLNIRGVVLNIGVEFLTEF